MSQQQSLDRHVVQAHDMHRGNTANNVDHIDCEKTGFTRCKEIFKTTRDKLKQMHKDGKLKKNYAAKHCSASWATSEDTDFLYLRPYITTADNKRHFDPSWLCVACNHYYAKHPECKYI
eukprot:843730_1